MPARYTLPVFNLLVNIWRNGRLYTDPPDVSTFGNLALGRRVSGSKLQSNTTNPSDGGMWLLLPKDTDIRDSKSVTGEDMVEVPAGTGRLYTSKWVDDCGKGFANEHRFAVIFGLPPWGVPFPGPPAPPPPPSGSLPYIETRDSGYVADSFTWPASGNLVYAFVWYANTSATPPIMVSSSQGPLAFLAITAGVSSPAGVIGHVVCYSYRPAAGTETLSWTNADPQNAGAFVIQEAIAAGVDQTGFAIGSGVTSQVLSINITGGGPDLGVVGWMNSPPSGVPVINTDFSNAGSTLATAFLDVNSDIWYYGWSGTPFAVSGLSATWSWALTPACDVIVCGFSYR